MDDQNDTTTDTAADSGADSSVIQELRSRVKDLERSLKEASKEKDRAIDAYRAQVQREQAATAIVNDLGYPKLAGLVAEKVEGDLTPESVAGFLANLGLDAEAKTGSDDGGEEAVKAVGDVANLGGQVAAAASKQAPAELETRIMNAESQEALAAIMAEAGLLKSH